MCLLITFWRRLIGLIPAIKKPVQPKPFFYLNNVPNRHSLWMVNHWISLVLWIGYWAKDFGRIFLSNTQKKNICIRKCRLRFRENPVDSSFKGLQKPSIVSSSLLNSSHTSTKLVSNKFIPWIIFVNLRNC